MIKVYVKGFKAENLTFSGLTPETKLIDLKKLICERVGGETSEIRLLFGSKQLDADGNDDLTFEEYGIQNNSTLMMLMRVRGGKEVEIKIRLGNDEEVKISINEEKTVKELKEAIYAKNNYMDTHMCLMFAGVVLKNEDKLTTLKLPDGAMMTQSKADLSEIKGLVVSYDEPDFIMGDIIEGGAAKMCCGHVIST
jgi:hypothetical protein